MSCRKCVLCFKLVLVSLLLLFAGWTSPGYLSRLISPATDNVQNDWNLVRASAVTPGRSGQRNESQHRQSTVEKKTVQPRNEPKTPQVKRTYTEPQRTEKPAWVASRDIMWHEPWPKKQQDDSRPTFVPPTVHYLWCGQKKFRFQHYLGVLSVLRVLQPTKLVFYYTHPPQTNKYDSWFVELKASLAGLELRQLPAADSARCGSRDMLSTALGFLSSKGGVYIGADVILARPPPQSSKNELRFAAPTGSADKTRAIVSVQAGFNETEQESYVQRILSSPRGCVGVDSYSEEVDCVLLETDIYPRDIMDAETPFAELARWLFYGKRAPLRVQPDPSNPIPRISHFFKLENKKSWPYGELYKGDFSFIHFLNILSALYVAGFQHVYVHAEERPHGKWWDELAKENVTFVQIDRPRSVFQNAIGVVQHVSDISRYLVLYKYGGAYQDFDVTWASRIPDSLLAYPAVIGMEWTTGRPPNGFPETFNLGVFMARRHSPWLRHHIMTNRDYRDHDWGYNVQEMSYKTYELHPDLIYLDQHLQVMCFAPRKPPVICHPPWEKGYLRDIEDSRPTLKIVDWQKEVRAFHMTQPKPHPSMANPEVISKGTDMFAEVARNVLTKSGRRHLLSP